MSTVALAPTLKRAGAALVRGALHGTQVTRWREMADTQFARIQVQVQTEGLEAVRQRFPPGHQYIPQVSSLSLESVFDAAEIDCILRSLATPALMEPLALELGQASACNLDRAWVRRQYAIHRRPPGHVPHSWHQDGALLYPFDPTGTKAPEPGALLSMVTCWIALTSCGAHAPGLELVLQRQDAAWPPESLADDRVRADFAAEQFWRPVMEPGDAILFSGGTLHRTHVKDSMTADRTSLELRIFAVGAIPKRLEQDRFVSLPNRGGFEQ